MKRPVKKDVAPSKPRGRPRSEQARRAIMKAARTLLAEGGPGAITMESVAALAGVGKPTVYRWWPDRHAVAMAALMASDDDHEYEPGRRSAVACLREQLHMIAKRFGTHTGRHITSLIAASEGESELAKAFRNHFVLARRAEGKVWLERAQEDKEIRSGIDLDVALDLLYGALFFRLLMGHAPLDEQFVDQVLDQALRGMRRPKGQSPHTSRVPNR